MVAIISVVNNNKLFIKNNEKSDSAAFHCNVILFLCGVVGVLMEEEKNQTTVFRKQPISCPWITSQPYHSSLWFKNRGNGEAATITNRLLNPWPSRHNGVIQQSSSHFFYFLRLMQLFPDTHPATIHTVLMLCHNDFFCAVDKLLYAKRCRILSCRRNGEQNRARSNPKPNEAPPATTVEANANTVQSNTKPNSDTASMDRAQDLSCSKVTDRAENSVVV